MSEKQNGRVRGEPTDLEIEAYVKASYPDGIDSHGAPAPTVSEVRYAMTCLDIAASLLEPNGELGHMRAEHFEAADEALGFFIRAINPGDSYYVALHLWKSKHSDWLGLPVPEANTDLGDAA